MAPKSDQNKAKGRLQAFRKLNPRIDIYPTAEAYAAIHRLKAKFPARTLREVVDMLIIQGCKAYFPVGTGTHPTG